MKRLRASIITATLLVGWTSGSAIAQQSNELRRVSRANTQDNSKNSAHEIYGKILSVDGSRITIETRTRQVLKVDATDAVRTHMSVPLVVGHAIGAKGTSDAKSVLHAQLILRAKDSLDMWPADQ
jgi:hypothetical protein